MENDTLLTTPPHQTTEPLNVTPGVLTAVVNGLRAHGIPAEELRLDRAFVEPARYATRRKDYYSWNRVEKSLEHFIAAKLLGLGRAGHDIDVASEHSVVLEIYHDLFGCTTCRQDLSYLSGLNGNRIGATPTCASVGSMSRTLKRSTRAAM